MIPGEIILGEGPITINSGAVARAVRVTNTGDRPIQVGSHYHFAESNPFLSFDREHAWGCRLSIPAGTSVRFEPGIARDVELIELTGDRIVLGLRGVAAGPLQRTPRS